MFYPIYVNPENNKVSLYKSDEYYIEVLPKRPQEKIVDGLGVKRNY